MDIGNSVYLITEHKTTGGAPGSSSVTWGNMANFETYTKKLAPWCPGVILPTLAWGVTIAELVLGLLLIVGLWRKPTAVLAALLTLSFALSMTVVLGPHEPLNYSVFVFAFASLYLGLSQDVE